MRNRTPDEKYFITDGTVTHYFPSSDDRAIASYFLDHGANLLYALAVDYPGLYKIPLFLREAVRIELKKLGFKTSRPRSFTTLSHDAWAMLYYLGPKKHSHSFGTSKEVATSFKVWFGSWGNLKLKK